MGRRFPRNGLLDVSEKLPAHVSNRGETAAWPAETKDMVPTGHTAHWAVAPPEPQFDWERYRWPMSDVVQDRQVFFPRVKVIGRKG